MLCRHCKTKTANRSRGLCWTCYYSPGVRDNYPSTSKFGPKGEPTDAEMDAMIAEQLPTMPPYSEPKRKKRKN